MLLNNMRMYRNWLPNNDTDIVFDCKTDSYRTISQEIEIANLTKELEKKEKKRGESVKSIIGYFYKSRKIK